MLYRVADLPRGIASRVWSTVIAPRPVTLLVTMSDQGANIAPYNSVSVIANNPPMVSVSFGKRNHVDKNTLVSIRKNARFTVNVVPRNLAQAASVAAEGTETGDDFQRTGLTSVAFDEHSACGIQECPAFLACTAVQIIEVPDTECTLVLARITHLYVSTELSDDRLFDPVEANLVASIGVEDYFSLKGDRFSMPRTWE